MSLLLKKEIAILVDNDSWILPFAEKIVDQVRDAGGSAQLLRKSQDIPCGGITFFLGCVNIVHQDILKRSVENLVVHASDLPHGRGFSPWTYAVLDGQARIAVCLIRAAEEVDAGDIYYKDFIDLHGTELVGDLRNVIGSKTVELVMRFLNEDDMPVPVPQEGAPTWYKRRSPEDSRLDPHKTIAEQFDLFRVVDNQKYPAFFDFRGKRYRLSVHCDEG